MTVPPSPEGLPLTPEELAELRMLDASVPRGPWSCEPHDGKAALFNKFDGGEALLCFARDRTFGEFIAAVRNALPALLTMAERCARAEAQVQAVARGHSGWSMVLGTVAERDALRARVGELERELAEALMRCVHCGGPHNRHEACAARWERAETRIAELERERDEQAKQIKRVEYERDSHVAESRMAMMLERQMKEEARERLAAVEAVCDVERSRGDAYMNGLDTANERLARAAAALEWYARDAVALYWPTRGFHRDSCDCADCDTGQRARDALKAIRGF